MILFQIPLILSPHLQVDLFNLIPPCQMCGSYFRGKLFGAYNAES